MIRIVTFICPHLSSSARGHDVFAIAIRMMVVYRAGGVAIVSFDLCPFSARLSL